MATWTFISPLWTFFSHLWIPQENYKMDYLEDDNLDQMTASLGVMKRWMDLEPFNSGNFKNLVIITVTVIVKLCWEYRPSWDRKSTEQVNKCNHLQVTIWTNKRMQAKPKQAEATLGIYN